MTPFDPLPAMWFAAPRLGAASEVWLMRQVHGLRRFRPALLTWEDLRDGVEDDAPAVHLMAPPLPARLSETGAARWIARAVRAPWGNFLAATPAEVAQLRQLAAADRPAVLLCHFGQTALRLLPAARALGLPLAVHFHGNDLSSSLGNRWYRWSLLRHLRAFDALVVVGTRQREFLVASGAEAKRVHLVPCGVPTAEFSRPASKAPGPAHFVTVSRLVSQKGVHVSLAAFERVAARDAAAHMTIVGDGPERARLEAQVRTAGLGERVRFAGALPSGKVRAVLQDATVFLQHSLDESGWYEGFGVAVTEAAAMKLPVVVSRCGGLADQVVDGVTGFVVDQGDVAGMSDAMLRLATDPARSAEMGEAGCAHVAAHYDTAGQIAKLEKVLSDLVLARPVRP